MRFRSGVAALFTVVNAVQFSSSRAEASQVQFGLSPDNDQSLLTQTIDSAHQEILINVYQFDSPEITQALVHRISQGVTVKILLEGQPLGKISDAGNATIAAITKAMRSSKNKNNHFFLMTSDASSRPRRYRYDHAKYVVIDSQKALICSENFTTTGHPDSGYVGNRGWEVVLEDAGLASQLTSTFQGDTSLSYGDVRDITKGDETIGSDSISQTSNMDVKPKIRHTPAMSTSEGDASGASLVTSPNSQAGIVSFIRSANQTLEIEQMSVPLQWHSSGNTALNPIVAETVAAAKRGVKVRVLLNDDTVFGEPDPSSDSSDGKTGNQETVIYLKKYARCSGVDLEARIVDVGAVEITYIHNKGMIADGKRVFVSSINGTRNAVMNNRETAVNLESPDAARYFEAAFDFDWSHSATIAGPSEASSCMDATLAR